MINHFDFDVEAEKLDSIKSAAVEANTFLEQQHSNDTVEDGGGPPIPECVYNFVEAVEQLLSVQVSGEETPAPMHN